MTDALSLPPLVPPRPAAPRALVLLAFGVAMLVLAVHWPALNSRAVLYDDNDYLKDNPLVTNPSWASVGRFFGEVLHPSTVKGYYQPLAMTSLMIDYALGGRPDHLRPFHRTSLLLHAATAVFVTLLMYRLFRHPAAAAAGGLLFGVHPLTVESIPWIAERKTLLAAFFGTACLWLYTYYPRRHDRRVFAGTMTLFILALLSKPTATPIPALILLLDGWPLRRLRWRAVLEKLPFFAVAALFAIVTFVSQSRAATTEVPAARRLGEPVLVLCHNIVFYLRKVAWPADLSTFYPYPDPLALSEPAVRAGLIGTIVLMVLLAVSLRWTRALAVAVLFFVVALLPASGVIKFTNTIAADRFAYFPMIGLLLPIVALLARVWSPPRSVPIAAAAALVCAGAAVGLSAATRAYLPFWKDTETAFLRMVELAPRSTIPRNNYGNHLLELGRVDEAIEQLTIARDLCPTAAITHNNLGHAFNRKGRTDDAIQAFAEAVRLQPRWAEFRFNLANTLMKAGRHAEAAAQYEEATRLQVDAPEPLAGWGNAMLALGRPDEAIYLYRRALLIKPDLVEVRTNLAAVLAAQGRIEEAVAEYRKALEYDPNDTAARQGLQAALTQLSDRPR